MEVHRSHEYGSTIIHSMATGKPSVVYGNMPNRGAIANLPADAIAEVPTLVDRNGPQLTTVGDLPPQLVGYIQPHVTQHELFIRAATEGRRDHIYQAAMFDPLDGRGVAAGQDRGDVRRADRRARRYAPEIPGQNAGSDEREAFRVGRHEDISPKLAERESGRSGKAPLDFPRKSVGIPLLHL